MSNGVAQGSDTNKMSNYSLTRDGDRIFVITASRINPQKFMLFRSIFWYTTELVFGMQIMLLTINNWNMEGETVT